MISSATAAAPAPAPATAPPAAAPAQAGPSFAQLLTEQAPPQPPATAANDGTAAAHNSAEANRTQARLTAGRRAAQAADRPKSADAPPQPVDAKAATSTDADVELDADVAPADDADTPELNEFTQLIGLVQPAAATPTPAPLEAAAAERATKTGAGDAAQRRPAPAAEVPVEATAAADTSRARAVDARVDAMAAVRGSTALSSAAAAEHPQQPPSPATPADSFAATLAQAVQAPLVRSDATPGALPTAAVQAPLHSPAFAPEMSARVSLLAVDGVQHAELQLNPAEMGPLSVQIVLDGNQAQVSFHAQQAQTRAVLEQCLPDLAAALQGQGLTLSGGGVFQQAPRDAQAGARGDGTSGQSGGRAGDGPARGLNDGPAALPQRRSQGLLDAFA